VILGVLAAPGPLQLLQIIPYTEVMTLLPLALIPTVVVPICIALHILSLRRLSASDLARQRREPRQEPTRRGAPGGQLGA
jgi:hypothetical protein